MVVGLGQGLRSGAGSEVWFRFPPLPCLISPSSVVSLQKVRCGPVILLQPRLPSHGFHRNLNLQLRFALLCSVFQTQWAWLPLYRTLGLNASWAKRTVHSPHGPRRSAGGRETLWCLCVWAPQHTGGGNTTFRRAFA